MAGEAITSALGTEAAQRAALAVIGAASAAVIAETAAVAVVNMNTNMMAEQQNNTVTLSVKGFQSMSAACR
jgi:hypothetical protein